MPNKMCTGGFRFGKEFRNFKQYQQIINLDRQRLLNGRLSYVLGVN